MLDTNSINTDASEQTSVPNSDNQLSVNSTNNIRNIQERIRSSKVRGLSEVLAVYKNNTYPSCYRSNLEDLRLLLEILAAKYPDVVKNPNSSMNYQNMSTPSTANNLTENYYQPGPSHASGHACTRHCHTRRIVQRNPQRVLRSCIFEYIYFWLRCPRCGRKYSTGDSLALHMKKHEPEFVKYKCKLCAKEYENQHQLTVHHKMEHTILPLICKTCGKSFVRHDFLLAHRKTHTHRKDRSSEKKK